VVGEDGNTVPLSMARVEEEREKEAEEQPARKEDNGEGSREEEEDGECVSPTTQLPSIAESPLLSLAAAAARAER